jgi:uncharacterized protein (TIGR02246 family)
MRQAILVLVGVTLLTAVAGMQTKVGTAADEAAIRKAWADYVTTWNKHDAMALASFYTDDVDRRTQNGKVSNGRAAVVGAIDDEFRGTNKETVLSTVQLDVRFVNRDVAILDARDELRGTEGAEASVVKTNHTSVFVRRDSKWLTVAIRAFRF